MAASLKINWTEEAVQDLDYYYNSIVHFWSEKVADKFLDQVMEFENLIAKYPESFIASINHKHFRLGLINPLISCIYEVRRKEILIIAIISNRENWLKENV